MVSVQEVGIGAPRALSYLRNRQTDRQTDRDRRILPFTLAADVVIMMVLIRMRAVVIR